MIIFYNKPSSGSYYDVAKNPKKLRAYRLHLNKKLFSAASTGLTHRQLNALENNGIIRSGRKDKKKWRTFSYKERIFLLIITELRKYGLRDKQLRNLRNAFFKKANELDSDMVIAEVLEENKVVLLVNSKGEVSFHGPLHLDEDYTSFININLNEIIESLRQEIGATKKLGYITDADILTHMIPSGKEREILKIIRDKDYKNIRKIGGGKFVVKGEKTDKLFEEDLIEMIGKKDFVDIKIIKRNGEISLIKVEDTYKI
jgi:DNA-binding transcriptional MerR regulator